MRTSISTDAFRVFLLLRGMEAFAFALVFTVNIVYHIQTVGLNPLQVVLVGTVLEITCLLLEVPTGVVADVYSRRLSVIIGFTLMGVGFMVEGGFGTFAGVLLAQVIWGAGATFISGATDAWLADEIGEARAGQAYLRASQVGSLAGLAGIGVSVLLASLHIQLPIVLGGVLFIVLATLLSFIMPEKGFQRVPTTERQSWRALFQTLGAGVQLVRQRRMLLFLLLVSVVFGMFSEGWDRLWTAHVLALELPQVFGFDPIVWFGIIGAVGSLVALVGVEFIRRRVRTDAPQSVVQALLVLYTLLISGVVGFALAPSLLWALLALWSVGIIRSALHPLESTWLNMYAEPKVRATLFSMYSQSNAFGQIAGGPVVGWLGTVFSLRLALSLAGLLLLPGLLLFRRSQAQLVVERE